MRQGAGTKLSAKICLPSGSVDILPKHKEIVLLMVDSFTLKSSHHLSCRKEGSHTFGFLHQASQ